jgi:hypothetical protein
MSDEGDDGLRESLDNLMAAAAVFQSFVTRLAVEIARTKEDPEKWRAELLASMHSAIDGSERVLRERGQPDRPTHEIARSIVDQIGKDMRTLLG